MNILAAVLITGGATAELYHPSSGTSCMLPTRQDNRRYYHTLENSGLMCGGPYTSTSCLQWSPVTGTWQEYLTLNVSRMCHISWTPDPDIGTYLMGGFGDSRERNSTILIKPDRSQEPGFPLKHFT